MYFKSIGIISLEKRPHTHGQGCSPRVSPVAFLKPALFGKRGRPLLLSAGHGTTFFSPVVRFCSIFPHSLLANTGWDSSCYTQREERRRQRAESKVVITYKFADGRIAAETKCFLLYFFLLNGSDLCRAVVAPLHSWAWVLTCKRCWAKLASHLRSVFLIFSCGYTI
jgi:hypothetical protein